MNIDDIVNKALAAMKGVLHDNLDAVLGKKVGFAITLLVQTEIEIKRPGATYLPGEKEMLLDHQKRAVRNVLLAQKGIDVAVAEKAISAAWDAIFAAVQAAA